VLISSAYDSSRLYGRTCEDCLLEDSLLLRPWIRCPLHARVAACAEAGIRDCIAARAAIPTHIVKE
jgi:hypothetical protein